MEINDKLFFCLCEEASLQVRPQIISPAKTTTLTTTAKTSKLGNSTPTALAIGENEVYELFVFLSSPWTFLHSKFVTARLPPHSTCYTNLQTSQWKVSPTLASC
ncbi:hypothetical protein V8G54_017428 [Vigna mungo]|uniref:Uncharacterized protein n=1 Tax=Vigna mungo TaxID=3915 RepID=A0AAQ3NPR7_VIGMU